MRKFFIAVVVIAIALTSPTCMAWNNKIFMPKFKEKVDKVKIKKKSSGLVSDTYIITVPTKKAGMMIRIKMNHFFLQNNLRS